MGFKIVNITENDTGRGLVSEILSIPLILRGTSDTPLVASASRTELSKGTFSEKLGLPLLSASSAGRANLTKGTTFGGFLPELRK